MDYEATNRRLPIYSYWHRIDSIKRYLNNDLARARNLGLIDIDAVLWLEYKPGKQYPVALIETAHDIPENENKKGTVICSLARRADLPCFLVLYTTGAERNHGVPDITGFRVRRLYPDPEPTYRQMTCREYALFLEKMRDREYAARIAYRSQ